MPRSRHELLADIYRRGTHLRRRRRLAASGAAAAVLALLVAVPALALRTGDDREDLATRPGPEPALTTTTGPSTTTTVAPTTDPTTTIPPSTPSTTAPTTTTTTTVPPFTPVQFVMSPDSGPPSTTVRVSGGGCRAETTEVSVLPNETDFLVPYVVVTMPVNGSGGWSGSVVIPPDLASPPPSSPEWAIGARCGPVDGSDRSTGVAYDYLTFDVTGPASVGPKLDRAPANGPPGTIVWFTSNDCDPGDRQITVGFHEDRPSAPTLVSVTLDLDENGSVMGRLQVPSDADPDPAYLLSTTCDGRASDPPFARFDVLPG